MHSIDEYRRRSGLFLLESSAGFDGRDENDPVYQRNTEGRDRGVMRARYSSCGDNPLEMLEFLGVRGKWLNRETLGNYKVGMNIARLCDHPCRREPRFDAAFECGDILVVWNRPDTTDAHAIAVLRREGNTLHTVEYGQPGAARRERKLAPSANGGVMLDERRARVWLPLAQVIANAELCGEMVETDQLLLGALEAYPERE